MSFVDAELEIEFRGALVSVAIVVALYVFVGNSGVISFGHVSFVAVGAFTAGVMTVPVALKPTITPGLFSFLGEHSVGNARRSFSQRPRRGVRARRRHTADAALRPRCRHRHVRRARSHLQHPLELGEDRPGSAHADDHARDDRAPAGDARGNRGRDDCLRVPAKPLRPEASRSARGSRGCASRRDRHPPRAALGVRALGGLVGVRRRPSRASAGTLQAGDVYLELTFLTLAMLVVGGVGSLWGAVVGALVVSALDTFLLRAEAERSASSTT